MDTLSKTDRSRIMASVKSKNNKSTELQLITILRKNKIKGWRRNYPLLGNPDFVFRKARVVVFVDGCFWHKCPKHCRMPKSNVEYWEAKIEGNKRRDKDITRALKNKRWKVVRIWEHEVKLGGGRKIGIIRKLLSQERPGQSAVTRS